MPERNREKTTKQSPPRRKSPGNHKLLPPPLGSTEEWIISGAVCFLLSLYPPFISVGVPTVPIWMGTMAWILWRVFWVIKRVVLWRYFLTTRALFVWPKKKVLILREAGRRRNGLGPERDTWGALKTDPKKRSLDDIISQLPRTMSPRF